MIVGATDPSTSTLLWGFLFWDLKSPSFLLAGAQLQVTSQMLCYANADVQLLIHGKNMMIGGDARCVSSYVL